MTFVVQISPVNMDERKNLGIRSGDNVRVWQKIQEKGKTRLQAFEGLVLSQNHGSEAGATFTVRRVASGVGMERIFPLYSPIIDKIEILKRAKVRRAKLFYIRDKVAREIKRQMRRSKLEYSATESEAEAKARIEKEAVEEAAALENSEETKEEVMTEEAEDTTESEPEADSEPKTEEKKEENSSTDDSDKPKE